ncbi:hypothetical protein FEP37_01338 [Burkholderia multivorans]|nr:hypothetical protein [Burkholderia multivorans]MDR9095723.1 hypothetical protein [Burkholderia multivorans]MDR9115006.1 hypothetical protein [Burkholderia multivorans]MDR9160463.1 hypothetical protein [Burkholderia multivorans]MDR9273724.1 hypothetical protein [Burkholderia multivorans]
MSERPPHSRCGGRLADDAALRRETEINMKD